MKGDNTMKLTTMEDLNDLSALLDKCVGGVYIGSPDGRSFYDTSDKAARLQGLIALAATVTAE